MGTNTVQVSANSYYFSYQTYIPMKTTLQGAEKNKVHLMSLVASESERYSQLLRKKATELSTLEVPTLRHVIYRLC